MYLNNLLDCNNNIKKLSREAHSFSCGYDFWLNWLFERVMRLFVWDIETPTIRGKNIEGILLTNGTAFITDKYKNALSAYYSHLWGETQYYDEFTKVDVNSPLWSESLSINTDGVLINNNSVRNSVYPLLHRYAIMLSHTEVTYCDYMINLRDAGSVPTGGTRAVVEALSQYNNDLCNGKIGAVYDPALSMSEWKQTGKQFHTSPTELLEARKNLLESFFNDIGVRTNHDKKGNMIVEEISSNDAMLLFNLDDMLECRKKACEAINKKYGVNWSVTKNKELVYNESGVSVDENND